MPHFETGYPPFLPGYDQHAYDLGCKLLDIQDRLLVKHKNKFVRALLQLDEPCFNQELFSLGWDLQHAIEGIITNKKKARVLKRVVQLSNALEAEAKRLGL